jgi:hypothetical protein
MPVGPRPAEQGFWRTPAGRVRFARCRNGWPARSAGVQTWGLVSRNAPGGSPPHGTRPCSARRGRSDAVEGGAARGLFPPARGRFCRQQRQSAATQQRRVPPGHREGPSAVVAMNSCRWQDAIASLRCQCLPKLSNSPLRAPPRKACHSSGVNRRTGPSGCLLLRTATPPSAMLATSTQLPLEKLSELLTQ